MPSNQTSKVLPFDSSKFLLLRKKRDTHKRDAVLLRAYLDTAILGQL
jgi:hypothetical protein